MKFEFINNAAKREFERLPQDIQNTFLTDFQAILQGSKPFSIIESLQTVGKGSVELKINGSPAYRCIYCAKFNDTLYILHSFVKTTNGVDRQAMKTAKQRFKAIP
jgi:phage-related protein